MITAEYKFILKYTHNMRTYGPKCPVNTENNQCKHIILVSVGMCYNV